MKKFLVCVIFVSSLLQGCGNEEAIIIPEQEVNELELNSKNLNLDPCGTTITGSYNVLNGNHFYPTETLDFGCADQQGTISITVKALKSPNTFEILDGNGNLVAYSGWMGYSAQPGPWGSSLNGLTTQTFTFAKTTQTYQLKVFTITQGWTDDWSASISCQNVCEPPTCDATNSSCGTTETGAYNVLFGNHFYPTRTLDVECVPTGNTITITLKALKSPNTFQLLDANGNSVFYSDWMGYSAQWGPWGQSLNGPYVKTYTFPKVTDTYQLKVFTITQGWTDDWSAAVACQL